MRSRTSIWFECKVKYEKVQEDGLMKQVIEQYVVNALSFSEAEARITEEMAKYISGEFNVVDIKQASYKEVFFAEDGVSDRWYKVKLQFITIDENTGKEKRQNVVYLFQAGTFEQAKKSVVDVMGGTMIDYVIAKIEETTLFDVFEYAKKEEKSEE
jgi:hypothetical protein